MLRPTKVQGGLPPERGPEEDGVGLRGPLRPLRLHLLDFGFSIGEFSIGGFRDFFRKMPSGAWPRWRGKDAGRTRGGVGKGRKLNPPPQG